MIYRSKFMICFIHIFFIFSLFIFIDDGLDVNVVAFLISSMFAALMTYMAVRYFKVIITDDYLRGYDFWGKYHSAEWNSIININPIQIAGLKYVRVESTKIKRPLWIPLFLNDMSGFKSEANKRLDTGNPLKMFLDSTVSEAKTNA